MFKTSIIKAKWIQNKTPTSNQREAKEREKDNREREETNRT